MSAYRAPAPITLWCPNQRIGKWNRWAFPPKVNRLLRELTAGRSVLHLFGGMARWGTRLDIDPLTRPHVHGDAWLPPFARDSFDVVIIDPPYRGINQQMKQMLLRGAAYVAREYVYWFQTQWMAPDRGMQRERSWLIRVGDSCSIRCLIEWRVLATEKSIPDPTRFTRGPALRYHRWIYGAQRLPLEAEER